MKKAILLFLLSILSTSLFAQEWINKMLDQNANLYEVQDAFYSHWQDKGYERGKGYKQFKRWEYAMEPRLYPSGNRINSKIYVQAWDKIQKMKPTLAKTNSEWQPVGPTSWISQGWNPGLGRINAITQDPNDVNTLYVCTPAGGLWKSTDLGDNWTSLTDHLPAIGASGLAIDPTNSNVLYLATGDGDGSDTYSFGVLKSIDGGETWETTSLIYEFSQEVRCSDILLDPTDPNKIWVATNLGLLTSTDAGNSWVETIHGSIRDIEVKPNDPNIVYAAGRNFYRSADGGMSFSQITEGVPPNPNVNRLAIAITAANPDLVYMIAGSNEDSGFYGFYRSDDSGQSFELRSDSPNILTYSEIGDGVGGQSWYDLAITASSTDENDVFIGGVNVWKTGNGGLSWEIISHWVYPSNIGYTHADIHVLEAYGNKLYCGSDGGIFSSNDDGSSWEDRSAGLQISQFYRLAVSTTNPDIILTAAQDNGTNIFNGTEYSHLLGGDGNAALIDYSNDQIMYSAYPGGEIQKSTNGGQSFDDFNQGIDESGSWVTPFKISPTNHNVLFAAFENVWRKSGNADWQRISNFSISGTLQALCIAPSDADVIYTAKYGTIFKTTDGGENWSNISNGLPNLTITGIEIHPENPAELWVTMSGYNANSKVFHSTDSGDNWENLTLNLPNIPVNCVSYQLGSSDGIYIGTDAGVFYKDNTYTNWNPYNDGLPNVIVNQIVFQYQTSKILLATFGRGVWENNFFDAEGVLPIAKFSENRTLICEGGSIDYSNLSLNTSDSLVWTFDGGNPAQSTENNPAVTYSVAGTYSTKLWVANTNGNDSLIQENLINVLANTGSTIPVIENFEAGSTLDDLSWYVDNDDNGTGWSLNQNTGYQSAHSAWINNYTAPPQSENSLLSRTFDLSQADTAIITMRVAYAKRSESSTELMKVLVSTNCGATWIFKKTFSSSSALPSADPTDIPFVPADSTEWRLLTIDNILPEERTSNFRMKLLFRSNSGNNIYVDNINIIDHPMIVATRDISEPFANVQIFPNPAKATNTELKINLINRTKVKIGMYDATGKLIRSIYSGMMPEGENTITVPLTNVASGVYTINIASDQNSVSSSLIVD